MARSVDAVILCNCGVLSSFPGTIHVANSANSNLEVVVGFRMPYDLPLVPYSNEEKPWCATARYNEPDGRGATWGGF